MLPTLDYSPPINSHSESSVPLQPATSRPTGAYSTVDIAMEMPRYLLQEDETIADEISEESVSSSDPHRAPMSMQSSVSTSCSGRRLSNVGSECVGNISLAQEKPSSSHRRHATVDSCINKNQKCSDVPGLPVSVPRPLTVCFPLVNLPKSHQLLQSGQVISLNATPISIATGSRRLGMSERKKHHCGGGWPKGRSRKAKGEMIPPKPPSTGYVANAPNSQPLT